MHIYKFLALSYRQWYYRMTTAGLDRYGATTGFATLQGLNTFSLVLLLPVKAFPIWLFVVVPFIGGGCSYWLANRIYKANPVRPTYAAKLTDKVPGIREFPAVYAYLLISLALFCICMWVAVRNAA
ncbi:hypothetical protein ACW7GZ_14515 [Luteimonas sp. A537]